MTRKAYESFDHHYIKQRIEPNPTNLTKLNRYVLVYICLIFPWTQYVFEVQF